jgi:hydrogenase/urease accessory protein HupE
MQGQDRPYPIEQDAQTDTAIMGLLLDSPRPLAVAEVQRGIADPLMAEDGIARLVGVGLAHELEGFVFASRAALHAVTLEK